MRNKTTKINRINLLVLLCAIFLSFNFVSAVNINPSTGGGSTVQIVNISSVSAGDSSIEVTGGSSITVNQTWLTAFTEVIVEGYNYLTSWLTPDTSNGYLSNDSTKIYFNDTKLNQTIDAKTANFITTESDPLWTSNQSNYYNKSEIDSLIPSEVTYYFWDATSAVNASYKVMNTTQNPTTTTHTASGLSDGSIIVYRINENTNLTGLQSGQLHLHTTATKTGGTQALAIKGVLAKRLSNGTIIDLTTTDTSAVLTTGVATKLNLFGFLTQQSLNATDMLLWRLQAVVTGAGTAPSVNITVGGVTDNGLDLPVDVTNIMINENDPLWIGNSTLVAYKAQNNNFSVNQNFQGNITLGSITIAQDGCTYYGLSRICGVA